MNSVWSNVIEIVGSKGHTSSQVLLFVNMYELSDWKHPSQLDPIVLLNFVKKLDGTHIIALVVSMNAKSL